MIITEKVLYLSLKIVTLFIFDKVFFTTSLKSQEDLICLSYNNNFKIL